MQSLIIFASGRGTNTAAILDYFRDNPMIRISLIVSNKADAGVLDVAREAHVPFLIIDRQRMHEALFLEQLSDYHPSLIILAGFLWKIPDALIAAFPERIINIHPALLPAYGGKGMYGLTVHAAVLKAGNNHSGITIHQVNEVYDSGAILLQARCPVLPGDNPETLAERIHKLEHYFYPRTIEFLLKEFAVSG